MKLDVNISTSYKTLIENIDKVDYFLDLLRSALLSSKLAVVTDDFLIFELGIKQCFSHTDDALSCLYQNGKMLNDIVAAVKGVSDD